MTRILCNVCGFPLVHCNCRTLKIVPLESPKPAAIDFTVRPESGVACTNNYTPPAPKKKGRSKFF